LQKGLQFSEERHKGDVDITQLRYYLAVTELGSFSKAATRCHVSQPALTVQMQKLEARMGKLLLNRNHRRIVPTEAGMILIMRAKEILALVENAKCEIRNSDSIHAGKVSFGILPTIAPYFLTHVLDSYIARCPKTQVSVHENTTDQSLQLIESGKLDFGIISLPVREDGFETETLFSEEMLLAIPPQHPLSKKRQIFTDDLRSEKFILLREEHCLGNQVIGFCNQHDFHPRIVFECGQLATVQSLVEAGIGISLIPQMAIRATPTIIHRQLENPRPKRSIAVVTRSKRHQKIAVQEFLKHLRQAGKTFERTA
jgi:LysR family hydrogen peroxide-inducible transcriptional activator